MLRIKASLLGLDWICLAISGYSVIDIASAFISGNLVFVGVENFIKLLISIAGFIYLCARTYHFIKKTSIERDILKEDLITKQNANFADNFKEEEEK